jgi:hypothetical protein
MGSSTGATHYAAQRASVYRSGTGALNQSWLDSHLSLQPLRSRPPAEGATLTVTMERWRVPQHESQAAGHVTR